VIFLVFLFLISCSEASESLSFGLELQTKRSSSFSEFSEDELSLRDPVDLGLLLKILSPFFKSSKSDWALRSYKNPFHLTSIPSEERTVSAAYTGGVYDPVNNQIVFVPHNQAPQPTWHRYDCLSNMVEGYPNPFHSTSLPEEDRTSLNAAYHGGVYDPVNNQIIFVPRFQASHVVFHLYDCATKTIETYPNPFHSISLPEESRSISDAYIGGVYDPVNEQIIFVPHSQASRPTWHRYDCATKTIETYPNPFHSTSLPEEDRAINHAYLAGVYDPVNKKIIFFPNNQGARLSWHRYDCASQMLESYENPFHSTSEPANQRVVTAAYFGGVYDAFNNQIVFVPRLQSDQSTWHRYDCLTEVIEPYENPFHSISTPETHRAVSDAYQGGVYDPLSNQIVFVPRAQTIQSIWHRYDCGSRSVEAYENPFHPTSTPAHHRVVFHAYYGGVYDTTNSQVIFIPYGQASQLQWHALQNYGKSVLSSQFAAHYLFNKF
jgi:hypothetical protein